MKSILYRAVSLLIVLLVAMNSSVVCVQAASIAPKAGDITITNNTGKADTVKVGGLAGGDRVRVYNAATSGKLLGSATASSSKTEVTVNISQLGTEAGSVYVSVTSRGDTESGRTQANYPAEVKSPAPSADNIAVTNNAGKADVVYVGGLYGGEVIKVYNAPSEGKLLGSITVPATRTEGSVNITQLGTAAGSVYVSITNKGELESDRTKADYAAEPKSEAISAQNVTIINNAGVNDTIHITYLSTGDTVKVYDAARGGNILSSLSVPYSKTEVTITILQLGTAAGSVYISVTNKGKLESDRTEVAYVSEAMSNAPKEENIIVTNNGGTSDSVNVTGLSAGDLVRVYDSAAGGTLLGSSTVASNRTEATVNVTLPFEQGSVYVSVTGKGKFESGRTEAVYSDEPVSGSVKTENVTITNNSGKSDTVRVTGLIAGDVVKVYDSAAGGTLLGSATVASSKTEATVTISQLGTDSGNVYISITSKQKLESARRKVAYPAEPVSDTVDTYNITVTNNPKGKADTVYVTGLTGGDAVRVYDSASGGTLLGSATVASSKTEATISITQLGEDGGTIYVTVTSSGKNESDRREVRFEAESRTDAITADDIIVTNNVAGTPDTVEVTSLTEGDMIKVYDSASGGKLLGSATVSANSTYATVTITQLGTEAGKVYVSITGSNKIESSRTEASYPAEGRSNAPDAEDIAVTNNSEASDTVEVTGLTGGDVVRVYNAAKGGSLLGSGTVDTYGSYVKIIITQLGTEAGSVYVSVTETNKQESDRTKADYAAESQSDTVDIGNIIVTNNAGTSDTVEVTGLNTDDVVKVYDAAKGGNLLGSAAVTSGSTATVSISQLGTGAGSVYVTVKGANMKESARVRADYPAEEKSAPPSGSNIDIDNNVGSSDVVNVAGLSNGDVVKVYNAATGGDILGTATAGTYETSVSINITQLGSVAGSVYVTVTEANKLESDRTKADYSAEVQSEAPDAGSVMVTNNAGMSDTVVVTGLTGGDAVRIYSAERGGSLLGTATADIYDTSVSINITQLGSGAGSIYVTVTGAYELESARTKVDYAAEAYTEAPAAGNISIVNNAGMADTVRVSGLTGGDKIKVYDKAVGGSLLGTATADTYDAYAIAAVTQLGSAAGTAYVSVTRTGYLESARTEAAYPAEPESDAADASYIEVANNAGAADTVKVSGLAGGDTVYVYESAAGGSLLGSGTVTTYDSAIIIEISQLGSSAGYVYVSVKRTGKLESGRTVVPYSAEQRSDPPAASNIRITNNADMADTVEVTYLQEGDLVKVYDSETDGTLLGSAAVAGDKTEVTVEITQLGSTAGLAYVSVTTPNKLESARTAANYGAEVTTAAPDANNITVNNYATLSDTVTVTFLEPGDVVKVYNRSSGGSLLGVAAAAEDGTEATASVTLEASGGSVYVTVKSTGKKESERTRAEYAGERKTEALSSTNIVMENNAGIPDTVKVSFLNEGDVIKVYDSQTGGTLLGKGTASGGATEVTIAISQLGTGAGRVYVSITGYGELESDRTAAYYTAERTSDAPDVSDVVIVNNSTKSDTVTVSGLMEGDVVKVYSSATDGTLLGKGTVPEDETEVTIRISQLGTSSGSVYISVTSPGAYESPRTKVSYSAE